MLRDRTHFYAYDLFVPYRNDEDAVDARRLEIERELGEVKARADQFEYLKWRQKELEAELASLEKTKAAFTNTRLPLLARARVASACNADWEKMVGDDRTRFCGSCRKNVYNLSAMTAAEAEALLREKEGDLCARLYRRADDTILTADCPVGLRRKWLTRTVNVALIAAAALTTAAVGVKVLGPKVDKAGSMGAISTMGPGTTHDTSAGMVGADPDHQLRSSDPVLGR